ncbi:MAG: linear amide C-N hydrolase [Candidatus Eisenbacteria bacterium]
MRVRSIRIAALFAFACGVAGASSLAAACTCFTVDARGQVLVGRNYDWDFSDGLVLVNKRGATKVAGYDASSQAGVWTSQHGSVTFNQYGRDFPQGGMNEAGLVVEVLWLEGTVFPSEDERLSLPAVQWIQYQLDSSATVEEVIASLDRVRCSGSVELHFFVADRTGETASVEYLDGKAVVHRTHARSPAGDGRTQVAPMETPVLTNDTYTDSERFLQRHEGFGGHERLPRSESSLGRFARAASGCRALASGARRAEAADLFRLLDDVSQKARTQWSIVYDPVTLAIQFRTKESRGVKTILLADLDFSCSSPVRILDVNEKGSGDLRDRWTDYSLDANRQLIGRSYAKTAFLQQVPAEALDRLAAMPDRFPCGAE